MRKWPLLLLFFAAACETESRAPSAILEPPARPKFGRATPRAAVAARAPAPVPAPAAVPEAYGAGAPILLVGDSHTAGVFGKALAARLREVSGSAVAVDALAGATAAAFPERLAVRLAAKPRLTILALGSNGVSGHEGALVDAVKAAGSDCVWVGPPDMRTTRRVLSTYYAALERLSPRCRLIDSRAFGYLRYPDVGGDGIHYPDGRGVRWAEDIFRRLPGGRQKS